STMASVEWLPGDQIVRKKRRGFIRSKRRHSLKAGRQPFVQVLSVVPARDGHSTRSQGSQCRILQLRLRPAIARPGNSGEEVERLECRAIHVDLDDLELIAPLRKLSPQVQEALDPFSGSAVYPPFCRSKNAATLGDIRCGWRQVLGGMAGWREESRNDMDERRRIRLGFR